MKLKECEGDLFHIVDNETYFAQGISADFVMKKGISVKFNMDYNNQENLIAKYGDYLKKWDEVNDGCAGFCILEDKVLNLVIKRNYRDEPSLIAVSMAFFEMRKYIIKHDIKVITMPQIGCGLEGLEWNDVRRQLEVALADLDVTVKVYTY